MTSLLKRIFSRITGGPPAASDMNWKVMHLPGDLEDPRNIVVYSGPRESDIWPALFMTNTLQKEFSNTAITVICSGRDRGLFSMLSWEPDVYCYRSKPQIPESLDEGTFGEGCVLFYPYSKVIESDRNLLKHTGCGIRIAPLDHSSPYVNLRVKTEAAYFPEKLAQMCRAMGIDYCSEWKPRVQKHMKRAAEQKMAPVSGRILPYIVTTDPALSILEKSRAEIPLRTVNLSGKNCDFPDIDREVKIAMVAGASAVAADSDDLWGDACALEVPVVGLDRTGTFLKWHGREAAGTEEEFIQGWVEILKKGW
ncbi:MAG: hypothetical protein GF388_04065 [Candidatus Aegiribacteria sp.]|nr:hypothetical protein [Candidatus Aegiribacteria sp.]